MEGKVVVFAKSAYFVKAYDDDVRCRLKLTMHCGAILKTDYKSKNEVWVFSTFWLSRMQNKLYKETMDHLKKCKTCKKHQPKALPQ